MKKTRYFLAFLLSFIMLFGSMGCSSCGGNSFNAPHMSKRIYSRPDENATFSVVDEIRELLTQENKENEISEKREILNEYILKGMTMETIAHINQEKDVTNEEYANELVFIEDYNRRVSNEALKIEQEILSSSYTQYFTDLLGEEYVKSVLEGNVYSDEELEILNNISDLETQYSSLYNMEKYDEIADIYTNLILKRNEFAKMQKDENGKNYENYLAYAYEHDYHRHYKPADMEVFRNAVLSYIKPVFDLLKSKADEKYYMDARIETSDYIEIMKELINKTLPEMRKSWDYMMDKGLYDFDYSDKKSGSSFVVTFDEFDDGFLFITPRGTVLSDLPTFVHEFGHYNEIFMSDKIIQTNYENLDLAETHSQCYELLSLVPFKDIFEKRFPDGLYDAYVYNALTTTLWSILSNCVFDKFEYICYNTDPALLNQEFYITTMDNLWAQFWQKNDYNLRYYDVMHLIQMPCYCISYAISMTFAGEIWASENNIETYEKLVRYGVRNDLDVVCKGLNMENPIEPATVKKVGTCLTNFINENLT